MQGAQMKTRACSIYLFAISILAVSPGTASAFPDGGRASFDIAAGAQLDAHKRALARKMKLKRDSADAMREKSGSKRNAPRSV